MVVRSSFCRTVEKCQKANTFLRCSSIRTSCLWKSDCRCFSKWGTLQFTCAGGGRLSMLESFFLKPRSTVRKNRNFFVSSWPKATSSFCASRNDEAVKCDLPCRSHIEDDNTCTALTCRGVTHRRVTNDSCDENGLKTMKNDERHALIRGFKAERVACVNTDYDCVFFSSFPQTGRKEKGDPLNSAIDKMTKKTRDLRRQVSFF